MRKISKRNKSSFAIFSVVVVCVIAVVVYMLIQQIQAATVKDYPVPINSVVYDKNGNYIDVSAQGTLKKEWTNEYRLHLNNKNSYDLGTHSVVRSGSGLSIYGSGYKVFDDGSIKTLPDVATVDNLAQPSFYKLQDRSYLLIGNDIKLKDNNLQARGYVLVDIDKGGNAFLRNDKINFKVVAPVVLTNGGETFDVANEMLTVGKVKTDLKKINGSTNEYAKIAAANEANNANNPINVNTKAGQNANANGKNPNTNNNAANGNANGNGNGKGNGAGGTGGGAGGGSAGPVTVQGADQLKETIDRLVDIINKGNTDNNTNNGSGDGNTSTPPAKELSSISLNGINVGVNSLTVDYYVSDVANNYASVYLKVAPTDGTTDDAKTIQLSKNDTRKQVYGLGTNKSYQITIGYIDRAGKEINVDSSVIRTQNITGSIYVSKVVDNTIYFNLKLDQQFKLDSANVVVYNNDDNTIVGNVSVDVNAIITKDGYNGSVTLKDTSAGSYKLRVENAIYEENNAKNKLDLDIETVVKNSWLDKVIKSIFG